MAVEPIEGLAVGQHHSVAGEIDGLVVHVQQECSNAGPAANAFVYIDLSAGTPVQARYLAWVNLYDIEHAGLCQVGRWSLCEPPRRELRDVEWRPFGWGAAPFPSVADLDHEHRR